MIKFCEEIGFELMPWQQWLAHHSLKQKPDGRWAHPVVTLLCARQQGKSTFMALQILFRIYVLKEKEIKDLRIQLKMANLAMADLS